MCLIRLALLILFIMTVISILLYAFGNVQWWSSLSFNDVAIGGSGRGLLIIMLHFLGLWCLPFAVMIPEFPQVEQTAQPSDETTTAYQTNF